MKSMNEICRQIAAATTIDELMDLHKQIMDHKYSYSLVDLSYMREMITDRSGEMGRRDAQALKAQLGL